MHAFRLAFYFGVGLAATATAQPSALPPDRTAAAEVPEADSRDGRRPSDLLRAAQVALVAGRIRQVQEALEMAETRMLDRSVPLGQTNSPSNDLAAGQIAQARQALQAGNRGACTEFIQSAIASSTAMGL